MFVTAYRTLAIELDLAAVDALRAARSSWCRSRLAVGKPERRVRGGRPPTTVPKHRDRTSEHALGHSVKVAEQAWPHGCAVLLTVRLADRAPCRPRDAPRRASDQRGARAGNPHRSLADPSCRSPARCGRVRRGSAPSRSLRRTRSRAKSSAGIERSASSKVSTSAWSTPSLLEERADGARCDVMVLRRAVREHDRTCGWACPKVMTTDSAAAARLAKRDVARRG